MCWRGRGYGCMCRRFCLGVSIGGGRCGRSWSRSGQEQSVTVIIPAHNEEQAMPTTLSSLMEQDFAGHLRIVVVPNGCDDRTAQVARSFIAKAQERGFELLVAELTEGCKPKALNQ